MHSTRNERLKIVCRPKLTIWPKKIMLTRHRRLVRILIPEARTGFCKIMGHCFARIQNLIHYPVMTHFLVQCAYLVLTFALCMGIALVWLQEELIKTHNFAFSRAALYKKTQRYVHKILWNMHAYNCNGTLCNTKIFKHSFLIFDFWKTSWLRVVSLKAILTGLPELLFHERGLQ